MWTPFASKIRLRETALAAVGVVALLGAIFTGFDLLRAVRQAEALYSVGMAGLSIEGDLQDYTQESRRLFVYALTTRDPNVQLTYVSAARSADREVARLHAAFSRIKLNTKTRAILDRLLTDWNSYLQVRDDLIGLILEDRADLALTEELAKGAPLFETCSNRLQELKRNLDQYAKDQLVAVQRTYYRGATEIGLMMLAMLLFIGSLRLLVSLKHRNQFLAEAELIERQRSTILEWINQNLPLPQIFSEIERLVERRFPTGRAVIALAVDSDDSLTRQDHPLPATPQVHSIPISSRHDEVLGNLHLYGSRRVKLAPADLQFVERAAQLAALAVAHRRVTDQLAYQAQHDSLTGLANRLKFQDLLGQAVSRASIHSLELAVLWIDLDRFKQVNDVLGHHVGDQLLQQVARRLSKSISDLPDSAVARMGGDEFVILLLGADRSRVLDVASTVLDKLSEPVLSVTLDLGVSASIGISYFPDHGQNPESLLRNADTAMYGAKFLGKSRYQVYDASMGIDSSEAFEIDRLLRTALHENQFEVYYQPQVGAMGIECVEALLRWKTASLGWISPARFIPIAEENGLIVPLGEWVLRRACYQASLWNTGTCVPIRVAVNVSPHQLVRSDFTALVKQVLAETGLNPAYLELELTETAVMSNVDDSLAQFERLRRLGVKIAIDDFGTGSSSLSYLRRLPVDTLKIDRSFVEGITADGGAAGQLIRAVVGLAHGLDLKVVAEGVETEAQHLVTRAAGCDLSQGFLFYKPMSPGALEELLECGTITQDLLELNSQVTGESLAVEAGLLAEASSVTPARVA